MAFGISVWALFTVASVFLAYAISVVRWRARSRGRPLPPGPWCLPLIGNVKLMQKPEVWKVNRDLCRQYGDVVYLPVFGQNIVILGSAQSIHDLLDKRSAITSDRQELSVVPLSGQEFDFALMSYGQLWKRHRKAFTQYFRPVVDPWHLEVLRNSALEFLRRLLKDSHSMHEQIRYSLSAGIIKVLYGVELPDKDPTIGWFETLMESVQALSPDCFLIQYLPGVERLPFWFPVVGRQLRQLEESRIAVLKARSLLLARAKEATRCGETRSTLGTCLSEELDAKDGATTEEQVIAENYALSSFVGAGDTTFAIMEFFFVAMSLYPDALRNAQAELDAVVGPNRLPNHSDRASLPYVNAVIMESLRWQNVAPIALPHVTSEDLEYKGYFIPKGTLLSPQSWACLHDPEIYPEPNRFRPERFLRDGKLNPDVLDPSNHAFGYGRRKCPGMYFADAAMFITMAMVMHVFDITPPYDEHGNLVTTEPKLKGSIAVYPQDCRCTIKPRSTQAEALILNTGFD